MKLAKAKEILKVYDQEGVVTSLPDFHHAVKLHIEASTFIILSRVTTPGSVPTLLNSETED